MNITYKASEQIFRCWRMHTQNVVIVKSLQSSKCRVHYYNGESTWLGGCVSYLLFSMFTTYYLGYLLSHLTFLTHSSQ